MPWAHRDVFTASQWILTHIFSFTVLFRISCRSIAFIQIAISKASLSRDHWDLFTLYKHLFSWAGNFEWIAIPDNDISIHSRFESTVTVPDTKPLCRGSCNFSGSGWNERSNAFKLSGVRIWGVWRMGREGKELILFIRSKSGVYSPRTHVSFWTWGGNATCRTNHFRTVQQ